MTSQFASEFTPELSQDYLARLLNDNVNEEAAGVGRARQEGESAGLVGQASTGSRLAAVEDDFNRNANDAVGKFNLDVAGKQYGERMTDEERAFQDTERQKQDDFQREMTVLGYNAQGAARNAQNRANKIQGEQGMVEGLGLQFGSDLISKATSFIPSGG